MNSSTRTRPKDSTDRRKLRVTVRVPVTVEVIAQKDEHTDEITILELRRDLGSGFSRIDVEEALGDDPDELDYAWGQGIPA